MFGHAQSYGKRDLAELAETAEMAETQEILSGRASTTLAL